MRTFKVIMIFEFLAKDVHVFVAKDDKMIKTCLLYELLDEGNVLGERMAVRCGLILAASSRPFLAIVC